MKYNIDFDFFSDFFSIISGVRKKFEKAAAGNRREFEERYGFLIENDAQVFDICHNGYHCMETSFNVLGRYSYIYVDIYGLYTYELIYLKHTI